MKHFAAIIAGLCLIYAGCAAQLTRLAGQMQGGAQHVVVWNGRSCTDELRTPRQLGGMARLTRIIARPNAVDMDVVFLEEVDPEKMQELLTRGTTIVLPSRKLVAFPAMESKEVHGVVRNGMVQIAPSTEIPVHVENVDGMTVRYRMDDHTNQRGVDFDFAAMQPAA